MITLLAFIDILNPFIRAGATILGIGAFCVYYYGTKDIDWDKTDEEQ